MEYSIVKIRCGILSKKLIDNNLRITIYVRAKFCVPINLIDLIESVRSLYLDHLIGSLLINKKYELFFSLSYDDNEP